MFFETDYASLSATPDLYALLEKMYKRRRLSKIREPTEEEKILLKENDSEIGNMTNALETIAKQRKVANELIELILLRYCRDKGIDSGTLNSVDLEEEILQGLKNWTEQLLKVKFRTGGDQLQQLLGTYDAAKSKSAVASDAEMSGSEYKGTLKTEHAGATNCDFSLEDQIVKNEFEEFLKEQQRLQAEADAMGRKAREMLEKQKNLQEKADAHLKKNRMRKWTIELIHCITERFCQENDIDRVQYSTDGDALVKWVKHFLELEVYSVKK